MLQLQPRYRKLNQECYTQILKALLSAPHTHPQLMDLTGLDRRTVMDLLKCFLKHELVHIGDWAPDALGRCVVPVWAWGPGETAPRKTPEELAAARAKRERLRAKRNRAPGTVFANAVAVLAQPSDPPK